MTKFLFKFVLFFLTSLIFCSKEIANDEPSSTLIPEEKVIFMLNARNLSTLTLAQLKHQCYPSEIKSVADEVCFVSFAIHILFRS